MKVDKLFVLCNDPEIKSATIPHFWWSWKQSCCCFNCPENKAVKGKDELESDSHQPCVRSTLPIYKRENLTGAQTLRETGFIDKISVSAMHILPKEIAPKGQTKLNAFSKPSTTEKMQIHDEAMLFCAWLIGRQSWIHIQLDYNNRSFIPKTVPRMGIGTHCAFLSRGSRRTLGLGIVLPPVQWVRHNLGSLWNKLLLFEMSSEFYRRITPTTSARIQFVLVFTNLYTSSANIEGKPNETHFQKRKLIPVFHFIKSKTKPKQFTKFHFYFQICASELHWNFLSFAGNKSLAINLPLQNPVLNFVDNKWFVSCSLGEKMKGLD